MRKALAIALLAIAGVACRAAVPPQLLTQWQERTLFTCCNMYYESATVNDANSHVGTILPFGSSVRVQAMTSDSVTFDSGATALTLYHSYGSAQESAQQYFSKILVSSDPHAIFATYPADVQNAIQNGRVEVGMTKEQVLMSLGYPPTHRTASTDLDTWTYWQNRWVTYQVVFGGDSKVANFIGNAPTSNQPIAAATPTPLPKAPTRRGKK